MCLHVQAKTVEMTELNREARQWIFRGSNQTQALPIEDPLVGMNDGSGRPEIAFGPGLGQTNAIIKSRSKKCKWSLQDTEVMPEEILEGEKNSYMILVTCRAGLLNIDWQKV
jgi:hypothetical protein